MAKEHTPHSLLRPVEVKRVRVGGLARGELLNLRLWYEQAVTVWQRQYMGLSCNYFADADIYLGIYIYILIYIYLYISIYIYILIRISVINI